MEVFFTWDPIANTSCKSDSWVIGNFCSLFPTFVCPYDSQQCLMCISMHWWLDSGVLYILLWAQSLQCCPTEVQYLVSTIGVSLIRMIVIFPPFAFIIIIYYAGVKSSWMVLSLFLEYWRTILWFVCVQRGCFADQFELSIYYMDCWDYKGQDSMAQIVLSNSIPFV